MEEVHGTHKTAKLACEDVISSMPDNVITNFMNRLPIQDAVRTCILARNWRLKWTLLTQFVLDSQYLETLGPQGEQYDVCRIISRVLYLLKGPVTKFSLDITSDEIFDVEDFNHWILFLSTKGIKELTVNNCVDDFRAFYKLPTHLFSCFELTHLKLYKCSFHLPPTFHGFPNLLSLKLFRVDFVSDNCKKIITGCPLLEVLEVDFCYHSFSTNDIAKLGNLKKLTMSLTELMNIDHLIIPSAIFQLLGFLPKLEKLNLDFFVVEFVVGAVARKLDPIMFPCLNTLILTQIDFGSGSMLSCAYGMIWGSPNLQKLRIEISISTDANEFVPPIALFSSHLDSNIVRQLQLESVVIKNFRGSRNEECLMKYLFAYSPYLKMIAIHSIPSLSSDEKLKIATDLLKLHRASPVAQVDYY